ncbi:MAG: VirB3 family type IV secretion system protein [Gammaproteobacteria bacterium]|nr:VirB3 family type IV secretion system protein [Gammaproteobacteria bacterium]
MENDYVLEETLLAVGLTKPPTKLGVPLVSFYLSIIVCFFTWMAYQTFSGSTSMLSLIVFIICWVVVYSVMAYMTFRDPFGLSIAWVNFVSFRKHTTHAFWGNTDSFAP